MSGAHSKGFFNDNEFTVSRLTGRNASKIQLVFKAVAISVTAAILIFCIALTSFFYKGVSHKEMLKNAKKVIETSGGMENGLNVLAAQNPDITSWIKINGTEIDYAVCTGTDDYYKNHNQERKHSRYGALYMCDGDTPQRTGNDKNIVICGNNMPDGTMFATLEEYKSLRFYKENPKIFFYFGGEKQQYYIFAVAVIDGENPDFNYKKGVFYTEEEFDEWYKKIEQRSIIDTPVTPTAEDEFLTLVTDIDDFSGAQLVVMACLADEWDFVFEDPENARVNTDVKYPKKWYNR